MRVVVNVTRLAHSSGREAAGSTQWHQAFYLEAINSLALYLPFLLTILVGFGVVVHSWWRQRRLGQRLLRAQPYYVAPAAGRLPIMIVVVCLFMPFGVPTAKRLLDLSLMIVDDASGEMKTGSQDVLGAGRDWGQAANLIWAASLGGQGVGTAAVGLMIDLAKRRMRSSAY